jgi:hypothetical protein
MPELTSNEYETLEQSLINEGCRDALVLWGDTLIDGYNRYEICQKHGIEFKTITLDFDSREDVVNWIIDNQLGRRNLTIEQKNYLIGKKYKREKQNQVENLKQFQPKEEMISLPIGQNVTSVDTAEKIGNEHKVSARTVKRAGKYADAIDTIAQNVDDEVRQEILNRKIDSTAKDVLELAKATPEIQREVIQRARVTGLSLDKAYQQIKYDEYRLCLVASTISTVEATKIWLDSDSEDEQGDAEVEESEQSRFHREDDHENKVPDWQEYIERNKWIDEYAFALAKVDDVMTLQTLIASLKLLAEKLEMVLKDVVNELPK